MVYLFNAIVVFAVGYSIFKMIRTRKLPSNNYTPYDDITMGKSEKDKD
ncbi:hypothetical protein [Bacillus sp. V59.32b]|nr:hypothetical protein [Bacillus sp. V59.32b]